jgi:hypothetical protein
MRWALLIGVALVACAETPPPAPPTADRLAARERYRIKRQAEIAAYKQRVKDAPLEAKRVAAAKERERNERLVQLELERRAREEAQREQDLAKQQQADAAEAERRDKAAAERQRERDEEAARPENKWLESHCQLSQPEAHYVMHCDPICWRETILPCPEYHCDARPPQPGWVGSANARVCAAAHGTTNRRARAIGEHGFPKAPR